MANDLESAESMQLFERNGQLWEVLGFNQQPTVELQRVGTRFEDVNRVSVIPDSPWGGEWNAVDPKVAVAALRDLIGRITQGVPA